MKKKTFILITLITFALNFSFAQTDYTFSAGLGLEFGSGFNLVGPSGKYFFEDNHAGQVDIGFASNIASLTFLYSYHEEINSLEGLQWYAGIGPSIWFVSGIDTQILLRPHGGVDYKLADIPLVFSLDFRPAIGLTELGSEIGVFGISARYVIE